MPVRTHVLELLDRTATILKRRGLAKHTHRAPTGEVCIFGALEEARVELDLEHTDACRAAQAMYDTLDGRNPATENDARDVTLDDVLDLVERSKARVA